jgi:hypothetical protein
MCSEKDQQLKEVEAKRAEMLPQLNASKWQFTQLQKEQEELEEILDEHQQVTTSFATATLLCCVCGLVPTNALMVERLAALIMN